MEEELQWRIHIILARLPRGMFVGPTTIGKGGGDLSQAPASLAFNIR